MPYISEEKIQLEDTQFECWVIEYSDYLNYIYQKFELYFDDFKSKKDKQMLFNYLLFINSSKQKKRLINQCLIKK